jgi:hypothetical protein
MSGRSLRARVATIFAVVALSAAAGAPGFARGSTSVAKTRPLTLAGRPAAAPSAVDLINLAGMWRFQADPGEAGIREQWFLKPLADAIRLPGSMAENGKGDEPGLASQWTGGIVDRSWFTSPEFAKYRTPGNIKVPFWLTPEKIYVGPAWYRKEVQVPDSWKGRRIVHWESRLWVDGREAGLRNSLGAPHEYDLTELLAPGAHTLALRIDNRIKDIDVGEDAHSVSDHTQSNWNGLAGRIQLQSHPPVSIGNVLVFPDVAAKSARVEVEILNRTNSEFSASIVLEAETISGSKAHAVKLRAWPILAPKGSSISNHLYELGADARLWDEFDPAVYRLTVRLQVRETIDEKNVLFGLREFKAAGTRFAVNGRPVFLRGTLECCIFPKTGYPPSDIAAWERIYAVCKSFGLNHVRFHSWCPPDAAFEAADRAGVYLYVECCAWTDVGSGKPFDAWLYEESERIVRAYGNHPSFCMMSYGNEPAGNKQTRFLGDFVTYWKQKDSRRVYTSAAGWPAIPENDWHSAPNPRIQLWGGGLKSVINAEAPKTTYDWRAILAKYDKPVVSHEIGQWCVYPDFREIAEYTGPLKARNFEIFRDTLDAHGLGALAGDFLQASGKLQALCYKADIEAAFRTPGMAGFELLDLHDFPGQGTALVGVLNPFWEEKGYITAAEYRRFCNSTVPLARMEKMIFRGSARFTADIEVAHFGPAPLRGIMPLWEITDAAGTLFRKGILARTDVPIDNGVKLGRIEVLLDSITKAGRYVLSVTVGGFTNTWNFWVYPEPKAETAAGDVMVVRRLEAPAIDKLRRGGKVLLCAEKGAVRPEKGGAIALGFSSIFWNTAWTRKQPPHTLGLLCDPKHPALAGFPTDGHSDYQWWDAVSHGQAMILDEFGPGLKPIIRVIDDWTTNRSLGLAFECRAGGGKLLVVSSDLLTDVESRPEARQLLHSLKTYMSGPAFEPRLEADPAKVRGLFVDAAALAR